MKLLPLVLLVCCVFILGGCSSKESQLVEAEASAKVTETRAPLSEASYVGGEHCSSCHRQASDDWHESHHDLAMQEVSETSVLGNFDNASFQYADTVTEFRREKEQFVIRTDGPDGSLSSYPVAYVFGVYPLQQYLLALPGGRLQAFSVAWDSRSAEEGGQRWFHLYPDQNITHDDPLHWTRHNQNWNYMCAECHSTHLEKNYNSVTKAYETSWSQIDVSCEACHGPASNHLLWADESAREKYRFSDKKGLTHLFDERKGVHWSVDEVTSQPKRSEQRRSETEIQVCAACHSRRSQFFEDDRLGQSLMESFKPVTLDEGLYHSDGQVIGEVYVYGSFLQSKMHHAGVTCSDCHNPHSLELRAPGDGVCLQCHSADYTTPGHHHHPVDAAQSKAPTCAECHMPSKIFMGVDERRDHSFRIPRPDLSVKLGVPNSCNSCHDGQTPEWASAHVFAWYGEQPGGFQSFADTFTAARAGQLEAKKPLLVLATDTEQPAIVRATALRLLLRYLDREVLNTLAFCLNDPDPLVRVSAIESLEGLQPEVRWQLLKPLLKDPEKVVRAVTAEKLSDTRFDGLTSSDRQLLKNATDEYLASQLHNGDDPQGQLNLGIFYLYQGKPERALGYYREAMAIDDSWLPAYVNLADLYRIMDQDDKGRELLTGALLRFPDAVELHYSLGLLYVRQKEMESALPHLKQSVELSAYSPQFSIAYALGLAQSGRTREGLEVIESALSGSQDPGLKQVEQQLRAQLQR